MVRNMLVLDCCNAVERSAASRCIQLVNAHMSQPRSALLVTGCQTAANAHIVPQDNSIRHYEPESKALCYTWPACMSPVSDRMISMPDSGQLS